MNSCWYSALSRSTEPETADVSVMVPSFNVTLMLMLSSPPGAWYSPVAVYEPSLYSDVLWGGFVVAVCGVVVGTGSALGTEVVCAVAGEVDDACATGRFRPLAVVTAAIKMLAMITTEKAVIIPCLR